MAVATAAALSSAESAMAAGGTELPGKQQPRDGFGGIAEGSPGMRSLPPTTSSGETNGAQSSAVVTRYAVGSSRGALVRSAPTLRTPGTVVGSLRVSEAVTGRFNSTGYWFQVTVGPHTGRWVVGSLLHEHPRGSVVNGTLPDSALDVVSDAAWQRGGAPHQVRLSRAAADAFRNMNAAFRQRFGHDLGVLEGYRTLATQKVYANRFGFPRAAVPGTSNHGFGNAIDVSEAGRPGASSPFFYGHVYDRWMQQNAWKWGFDRPDDLDADGSNPEYWHYDFVG